MTHTTYQNRMPRTVNLLAILALMLSSFAPGNLGAAYAEDPAPSPSFTVFPAQDVVEGWNWPLDAVVHLTIDDPSTEISPDHEQEEVVILAPWGSGDHWVWFDFAGTYDMKPGDEVTLTDGATPRTHVVQNLSVTAVDATADTVAGTADPGVQLQVWVHGQPPLDVVAGDDSAWLADFAGVYDIVPGTGGRSQITDEAGNATAVDWSAPNPRLIAFPENEAVEGLEWPEGAVVHLTVDDPATEVSPDFERDGTMVLLPWDPRPYVRFDFAEEYDLKVGDVVTLTDGATPQTHVVQNLSVTAVDAVADTVAGTADPGVQLQVWAHQQSAPPLDVVADDDGAWLADLTGVYDIVPGTGGRSQITDETGNATAVDWNAPNPRFIVFPEAEWFDGLDWPDGAIVSISVEGKPECNLERESWGGFFNGNFPEGCNVEIGDTVTFDDGTTSRTHTVQNLAVTAVGAEADTVTGTANPGVQLQVWAHQQSAPPLDVVADDDGAWLADFAGVYDIVAGTGGRSQITDEAGNATAVDWSAPWPILRDEFDGSLAEGWHWVNENPEKWNLTEQPGFLRIYNSPFVVGGENLLLRPVAQGDFMIKTRLLFEPDTNFQFAGLVIWQDENNFLQLGRAFCDIPDVCVGNGIYFDKILGGNFTDSNFATSVGNPSDILLRLERRGDMVRGFYSLDEGITWYEIGMHWIPSDFQVNGVGLTSSQDHNTPDWDIPADFDFFEITEGWGFLPEGFHDYDQGDVPSWACNAGGWAADPDDRAADVNIEIVVDDQHVANLVAGEFRQDLLDAGVCVDGNCSFSTSLWGAISSYEPHRVDVWAQDTTRGDWILLSNSAKTLTCRTYDIYTYDTLTGETRQITNLRDTGEYNPSWSPNGKWIAHDVVRADGDHGLYVTNVQTGVSTPLAGAEGGNDAAWSPNSLLIAFDRELDSSLYVVPPIGGRVRLVRSDAISPAWSPTGLRLAFHQPSDGSIRTMTLNGGGVKLIAASGENPVWSPDGKWIAYEHEGDIWKVRVTLLGVPLGGPIQVTTVGTWDGQATWSADSQTIAFHSGISDAGRDFDIWTIPAAGGMATWLTGAPGFGDYDPTYSKNGRYIAYASFSPAGQAARTWIAAYTYDLPVGTWTLGEHVYHFDAEWSGGSDTTPGIFSFNVSSEAPLYDGYVLLRPFAVRAKVDGACPAIDTIRPDQPTRFHVGYLSPEAAYQEAQAFFDSLTARAVWDDGMSAELVRHEIRPYSPDDWWQYVCTYTE